LLAGGLDYKLTAGSNVKVTNLDATRKDPTAETVTYSAEAQARGRVASVVGSPAFIIGAGSGVGVASGLITAFAAGSSNTATAASATTSAPTARGVMVAHCPPISFHL
jgi:hypothetical protein